MQLTTRGIGRSTVLVLSAVVLVGVSVSIGEFSSSTKPLPEMAVAPSPVLCMDRIWSERHEDAKHGPATIVHARVRAVSLPERSGRVQLRLRDQQGALVKTVAGSPEQYEQDGHYCLGATKDLVTDEAKPKTFSFPVPDEVLDLPADQRTHVVAEALVSCGDLTSISQGQITLVPDRRLLASRTIRIIRAVALVELALPDLNVGGMEEEWWRVPIRPTENRTVSVHVEADGLRGRKLTVQARLWSGDSWVTAASNAPPGHRDDRGRFLSRYTCPVQEDHSGLPDIRLPIPRDALNLPRDRSHHPRLVCTATCGGLTATWSDVIELTASRAGAVAAAPTGTTAKQPEESPHLAVTRTLLAAGRIDKNSELLLAAGAGDTVTVRFLLRNGADPQTRGGAGRTPMHLAAANGHRDVAEVLTTALADADKPPEGTSPSTERISPTEDIFSSDFGKKPEEVDTEHKAVSFEEYTQQLSFDRFMQVDAIVNATDDQGMMPLHLAAYGGHADTVEFLLANNANVEIGEANGLTALHLAAMGGHLVVGRKLLAAGADALATSADGLTPFDLASRDDIKTMLRQSTRGDRPDEKAVGQVIARFMEAVRQRDATGAMLLATPELAGKLPREILPVEFQYRMLSTRLTRPRPRVVVWIQVADLPAGQNELAMTFHMEQRGQAWRISEIETDPYIEKVHGREVKQ